MHLKQRAEEIYLDLDEDSTPDDEAVGLAGELRDVLAFHVRGRVA